MTAMSIEDARKILSDRIGQPPPARKREAEKIVASAPESPPVTMTTATTTEAPKVKVARLDKEIRLEQLHDRLIHAGRRNRALSLQLRPGALPPIPSFTRADGSFDGRAAEDYYDEDFRDFADEED